MIERYHDFCVQWLEAWTGNRPDLLLKFYSSKAFYRDPAYPKGLVGHEQLLPYFVKLLSSNPHWTWKALEIFPTTKGFTLKWEAQIPVNDKLICEQGLDIVELEEDKIIRNEVFFDTRLWFQTMHA